MPELDWIDPRTQNKKYFCGCHRFYENLLVCNSSLTNSGAQFEEILHPWEEILHPAEEICDKKFRTGYYERLTHTSIYYNAFHIYKVTFYYTNKAARLISDRTNEKKWESATVS